MITDYRCPRRPVSLSLIFTHSFPLSFYLMLMDNTNTSFPPQQLLAFVPERIINFACFGTDKRLSFIMRRTVHWYITANWVIKGELCHQRTPMSFIATRWKYEVRHSNRIQPSSKESDRLQIVYSGILQLIFHSKIALHNWWITCLLW